MPGVSLFFAWSIRTFQTAGIKLFRTLSRTEKMVEKRTRGLLHAFDYIRVGFVAVGIAVFIGVMFSCYTGALTFSLEQMDRSVVLKPPPVMARNEAIYKTEKERRKAATSATRIGFLKVEKASSSTMSGIFFRFGIRHNLSFALPKEGVVLDSYEDLITRNHDGQFDILAVHASTKEIFDRLLADNYIKIAVIREPLKRMISAAYFYRDLATKNHRTNYLQKIPRDNFIHNLINRSDLYEGDTAFTLTRNAMGKRFGFARNTSYSDRAAIKDHLFRLNTQFKLVLVTERLDESLVLMKRLLNWSLNDIIYLSKNVHSHEKVEVPKAEVEKYRRVSFIDYAIYKYFSDILEGKIRSAGHDFQNEVQHFQNILKKVNIFCESKSLSPMRVDPSLWNKPFFIFRNDCKLMGDGNPGIIESLRNRIGT